MRREDLAPEAAAVAAFLSDIAAFLDDEEDHESTITASTHDQLTSSGNNETLVDNVTTTGTSSTAKKLLDDAAEAERKRALRNLKTGRRRDAYRKRRKEEWQTLRCQEVELAARIVELQQKRKTDTGAMARSAWRAIAMRQLEGRRDAEAQQEKLKAAVKRRREVLQDVEITLRKRLKEASNPGRESVSSLDISPQTETADERLFEAYLEEMDAIYAKTDDVFQSCEMEPRMGPFLNTKPPKKKDGDNEYFENVGVLHVPFACKETCSALWEVIRQPYRQIDRQEYIGVEGVENTIAVRFRVKNSLQTGGEVSLLSHFVSRRYVEEERTVIIWRELWEGEGEFLGMHSDETGWCVIQPREGIAGANDSPYETIGEFNTVIKTCVRLVPMHFATNVSFHPDFDRFTEILVTSGKEDNLQVEHMIERLQLGDSLAPSKPVY